MVSGFWHGVVADGLAVPTGRPLADMTVELTTMLGDPDPAIREEIGLATLGTWVNEGVYDDLLLGLGDGMSVGLQRGLGDNGADTVFTRSFSALILAEVIDRDTEHALVSRDAVLRWGDRLASWFIREQDLRGFVSGNGWAHAVAHGADALGALGRSPHFGVNELTVLLDVVADRLLLPTTEFFNGGEDDRLALAVMHILRRDLLPSSVVEPWIARLETAATPAGDFHTNPFFVSGNVQRFLRSLQMQLALARPNPAARADIMLSLADVLTRTNAPYLGRPQPS